MDKLAKSVPSKGIIVGIGSSPILGTIIWLSRQKAKSVPLKGIIAGAGSNPALATFYINVNASLDKLAKSLALEARIVGPSSTLGGGTMLNMIMPLSFNCKDG